MPTDEKWHEGPPAGTIESRLGGTSTSDLEAAFKKLQAGQISDAEYDLIRARTHEACCGEEDED